MSALKPFTMALHERENAMAEEVVDAWIKTAERTPTLEIIPPGLDSSAWTALVAKFQALIGHDAVLTSHEHRVRYNDPYAEHQDVTEQEKRGSAATLFPIAVEHIQAILKLCNEHKVPIWTVSQGKNLGYGGPAARVKASAKLHLSHGGTVDLTHSDWITGIHHPRLAAHEKNHRGQ